VWLGWEEEGSQEKPVQEEEMERVRAHGSHKLVLLWKHREDGCVAVSEMGGEWSQVVEKPMRLDPAGPVRSWVSLLERPEISGGCSAGDRGEHLDHWK
jgi:hypothetical protein